MKYFLVFAVICMGFSAAAFADAPVVYLAMPGQFPAESPCPLLVRELARQSLLIAARDGLGLHTRDALMREWEPDAAGNPPADAAGKPALLMDMHTVKDPQVMQVDLFVLGSNKSQLFSDTVSTPRENGWVSVPLALENIEPLSRGKYLDQLKTAGFTGNVQPHGDKEVPDSVENLLYQTTLLAPFSVLQQMHAAIYESGESPARLSALVRAYANLGQLTRFQFSSINKVLTARSLLYAQRMVNEEPDSPFALYTRAYAFALTGLQAAAMTDIEQARQHEDELSTAGKPVPPVPRWVGLIDSYCKYDVQRLAALTPVGDRRLPLDSLLVYLADENCGSMRQFIGIGYAALQVNSKCFRIMDGINENWYWGAEPLLDQAQQTMLASLPDDIGNLTVVPRATQEALTNAHGNADHIGNLANVCNSFITAGESAEPSFTLAGRILQETNFAQIARKAALERDTYSRNATPYISSMARLFSDHPYRVYLESLKHAEASRPPLLKDMEQIDPQWQMHHMYGQTISIPRSKDHMTGVIGWGRMYDNPDATADDTERMLFVFYHQENHLVKEYAPRIMAISPYSGVAAGAVVRTDWKTAQPHIEEWIKRFPDQPEFLAALAQHYIDAKQPEKAEPILVHLTSFATDQNYCQMLANLYLDRGDEKGWLATLNLVLKEPNTLRDHDPLELDISKHFMATGEYDRARPYAEGAMRDLARGGEENLSVCMEYQGDYDNAEKMEIQMGQYVEEPRWFIWCMRSGHGRLADAQKAADDWAAAQITNGTKRAYIGVANVAFLEHRFEDAKKYYEIAMHDQHSALAALQMVNVCAELKDNDGRDAALLFCSQHCARSTDGTDYHVYANYAKLLIKAGDKIYTDEQVQKFLDSNHAEDPDRTGVWYFHGRQQQQAGDIDGAKKSYRKATALQTVYKNSYAFACVALHELGEKASLPPPVPMVNK